LRNVSVALHETLVADEQVDGALAWARTRGRPRTAADPL